MATPDYNELLGVFWGWGIESSGFAAALALASNTSLGSNPPYAATDFFAIYPQFAGTPLSSTVTMDGTNVLTAVSSTVGVKIGQLIAADGIPSGSTVLAVDSANQTITISANTTTEQTTVAAIYTAMLVPLAVLTAYIYLAANSIMISRYAESWYIVMSLYIAHYLTLWLQSQAMSPNPIASQVAQAGLALGVRTAKSAGDVSVGYTPIIIEDWGSFSLTLYGQQFVQFAKIAGMGGMLVW